MCVPGVQDPGVQVWTPYGWFQSPTTICNIACLVFNHTITGEICIYCALWFPLFSLLILTAPTIIMKISALFQEKRWYQVFVKYFHGGEPPPPLIAVCDKKSFGLCCQHAY